MLLLVTGGRGDLGRRVVPRLREAGHEALIGTRAPTDGDHVRFDLAAPPSAAQLGGVDVIVHLASDPRHPRQEVEGSAGLWQAAREAGVAHAVYISIVGIDDHPFPYYQAKREVERRLEHSGVPYSILRTTQFHSFIPRLVDEIGGRLRMVPVPGRIPVRPVDADVVADRLAELVEAGPSGRVADMAGPEVLSLDEMVLDYLQARNRRWLRIRLPLGGKSVDGFRRGLHLGTDPLVAGGTYRQYLERA
ncbi:MAG: SDR family oxidoreductase [Actinomycetota bacterium]